MIEVLLRSPGITEESPGPVKNTGGVGESQGSLKRVQVSFRVQVSLRKVQLLFKCPDVNKGQVVLPLLKFFFFHPVTRSSVALDVS